MLHVQIARMTHKLYQLSVSTEVRGEKKKVSICMCVNGDHTSIAFTPVDDTVGNKLNYKSEHAASRGLAGID